MRDYILAFDDNRLQAVEIPEWKTTVYVKSLTGADVAKVKAAKDTEVALVLAACCDKEGKPIFVAEDADRLKGKSFKALERIALAAIRHNAIGEIEASKNG